MVCAVFARAVGVATSATAAKRSANKYKCAIKAAWKQEKRVKSNVYMCGVKEAVPVSEHTHISMHKANRKSKSIFSDSFSVKPKRMFYKRNHQMRWSAGVWSLKVG